MMTKLFASVAALFFLCSMEIAAKTYHPGHYVAVSAGTNLSRIEGIGLPGLRGVSIKYQWKNLEPEKGKYDFSSVRADLDSCKKYGKQLVLFFTDKSFRKNERYMPAYLSHLELEGKEGWTPIRWSPEYMERLGAVMKALAAEFDSDPNFEGIALQESALSLSGEVLEKSPVTYSDDIYKEALKKQIIAVKEAFPQSRVFWYMNFIGGGMPALKELMDAFTPYQIVISGPDILPYRTGLINGSYKLYDEYQGKLPLANSVQYDSYRHHKNDTEKFPKGPQPLHPDGYLTMEDIFLFGRDKLHLDYIFWSHVAKSGEGQRTWSDAAEVIKKYPDFN